MSAVRGLSICSHPVLSEYLVRPFGVRVSLQLSVYHHWPGPASHAAEAAGGQEGELAVRGRAPECNSQPALEVRERSASSPVIQQLTESQTMMTCFPTGLRKDQLR